MVSLNEEDKKTYREDDDAVVCFLFAPFPLLFKPPIQDTIVDDAEVRFDKDAGALMILLVDNNLVPLEVVGNPAMSRIFVCFAATSSFLYTVALSLSTLFEEK